MKYRIEVTRSQHAIITAEAASEEELYEALRDPDKLDELFTELLEYTEHVRTTASQGDVLCSLPEDTAAMVEVDEMGFSLN